MSTDRQEYPAMLATLTPGDAVEVLSERVRLVGQLNTGFADWLTERRRIEEQYAGALRKLSRRPAIADPASLGIFATPWSALISNLENLADAHSNLGSKIESDLERPLRDYASDNREMKQMSTIQGNLASLAKDVDNAQKKAEKAASKGGNAQKLAAANTEMESARSQWESQAPFVFENLQALDEARINHLRDVLTQLQTHEVDKVERSRVAAEQCLNVLLTVDTADEIKMFALRTGSGERPMASTRRPHPLQSSASFASLPPSTPGPADDGRSQRSDSISELPTPKSDKPRGLRRLGTVLSRRRESKMPAGADRIGESPERTPDKRASRLPTSSSFANFGRSMRSRDNMLETPQEEEAERPKSPLRNMSSLSDARKARVAETNGVTATSAPTTNGDALRDLAGLDGQESGVKTAGSAPQADAPKAVPETDHKDTGSAIDAIFQAEREADQQQTPQAYKVDIQDASRGDTGDDDVLATMANTLKLQGPGGSSGRRQGSARGRRDNRASIYDSLPAGGIPGINVKSPIVEEPSSPPANVAGIPPETSHLPPASTATAAAASPPATTTSSAAFADVPSEIASRDIGTIPTNSISATPLPSTSAVPSIAMPFPSVSNNGPQTPISAAFRPQTTARDDTASIRSGRSQSSVASASHRHPEATGTGLNSSTIETVSANFEAGKLVKSTIIGEIALTNNSDATSSIEAIRLVNLGSSDKIAPNPAFISNDAGAGGVYVLNLAQLGRGKQQVAFKYQITSASGASTALAPLVVQPQWKIEPTQTSVIVSYSLSPSFTPDASGVVTLKDVTLLLHLGNDGGKAASCLSKPVGTFSKERGVLYWSLGDLSLKKDAPPTKLLARFQTESEAKPGRVEARWLLEGAGSDAVVEVKQVKEEDPFSDAEAAESWEKIGGDAARRKLVAGQYVGA